MSRYCIDTNIIVYTMNGLEPAADFMKNAQNEEIIYSVIVEAELFSSWKLTEEDIDDLREILDLGEIIEVTSSLALKAAELRRLSKVNFNRSLKLPPSLTACRSAYVEKHKYKFSSHAEYKKHVESTPEIIASPDYVALHPNGQSIEYIKRINEIMLIAVRIKPQGFLWIKSIFPITDAKLSSYIKTGRARKMLV